ncbi:MAG: hypothetical protein VKJ46_03065 [Leptolyngbyaceae bacterium]|nr:hypothetical protein [Leptolyngbyaceae bacterium]
MVQKIKATVPLILIFGLLFIGLGDSIFPQPLKGISLQTRNSLNAFMMGLVPKSTPKVKVYERTEKALEENQGGTKK